MYRRFASAPRSRCDHGWWRRRMTSHRRCMNHSLSSTPVGGRIGCDLRCSSRSGFRKRRQSRHSPSRAATVTKAWPASLWNKGRVEWGVGVGTYWHWSSTAPLHTYRPRTFGLRRRINGSRKWMRKLMGMTRKWHLFSSVCVFWT